MLPLLPMLLLINNTFWGTPFQGLLVVALFGYYPAPCSLDPG